MANLLEQYKNMQKVAEVESFENERVDAIVKYASLAEELLSEQYEDNQYNEDDVIKVAEYLIESDLAAEEEQEKVAEYDQLGRIMAQAFSDELSNIEE